MSPFDPNPPKSCPDPILGTREGWDFCPDCAAIKPPGHIHGDPIEEMSRDELIALIRVLRLATVPQESRSIAGKRSNSNAQRRLTERMGGVSEAKGGGKAVAYDASKSSRSTKERR